MAGFFKKFASAFVEFDPPADGGAPPEDPTAASIEADLAALQAVVASSSPKAAPAPPPPPPPPRPAVALPTEAAAIFSQSPEQVFAAAGFNDGPSTSPRVLKMLQGIAQFPAPQQLAMLRALDGADDTWTESDVVADAQRRCEALDAHLAAIEQTRQGRGIALDKKAEDAAAQRVAQLAEIDAQVAELMKLREEAVMSCAAAISAIEREKGELEQASQQARKNITEAAAQLNQLVAFFTAGGSPPR